MILTKLTKTATVLGAVLSMYVTACDSHKEKPSLPERRSAIIKQAEEMDEMQCEEINSGNYDTDIRGFYFHCEGNGKTMEKTIRFYGDLAEALCDIDHDSKVDLRFFCSINHSGYGVFKIREEDPSDFEKTLDPRFKETKETLIRLKKEKEH